MTLISDLTASLDSIFQIRDDLGAEKHKVYIIKRTKNALQPELEGFGTVEVVDTIERQLFPTPRIVDYSLSLKMLEGGNVKQGDLILKMISKNKFSKADINCTLLDGESENIERFYMLNNELYNVISITEDYCWWNVQIRKTASEKVYIND